MDSTENGQEYRGTDQEEQVSCESGTESSEVVLESKDAKSIAESIEPRPKWEHNRVLSHQKTHELLLLLKEGVEDTIKQTEAQIKNYQAILSGFKNR